MSAKKGKGHQLVDAGIDGLRRLKILQDNSLVKVTQPPHEGLLLVGGQVAVEQLRIPMVVHAGVAEAFPQLFRQPPLLLVRVEQVGLILGVRVCCRQAAGGGNLEKQGNGSVDQQLQGRSRRSGLGSLWRQQL